MNIIEVVRTLVTQCSHVMHSDTGFGEKGFDTKVTDESLVFCCYQQVYHIFNMSCLRVILQVSGHDGMSAPQNGAAAFSQSHVSHICQGGFQLPSLQFSSSRMSFYGRSSLTAEAFL